MEAEIWRWIWLGAAGVFLLGEVIIAGGVFMLPFAGGAVVASILAFAGLGDAPQWIAFIVVSAALFIALRPVVRKLNQGENPIGVGAARLIGETGTVKDVANCVLFLASDESRHITGAELVVDGGRVIF